MSIVIQGEKLISSLNLFSIHLITVTFNKIHVHVQYMFKPNHERSNVWQMDNQKSYLIFVYKLVQEKCCCVRIIACIYKLQRIKTYLIS